MLRALEDFCSVQFCNGPGFNFLWLSQHHVHEQIADCGFKDVEPQENHLLHNSQQNIKGHNVSIDALTLILKINFLFFKLTIHNLV